MYGLKKVCEVPGCAGCPLRNLNPNNSFVAPRFGKGLRLAIAEAPGEIEANVTGEPLTGPVGTWLRGVPAGATRRGGFYGKAGVRDEDVTFCNVIQCRPPDNVFPTAPEAKRYISQADAHAAVAHCKRAHVDPVLKARAWTRVDILGDVPLQFVVGKDEGISKWRGSPLPIAEVAGDTPICIPTYHPSYVVRDQSMIPVVVNDLRKSLVVPPEHYNCFGTLADLEAWARDRKEFCFDIETNMATGEITMVGLSAERHHVLVVPFTGRYVDVLQRLFAGAESVIGQNLIQFDLPYLERWGVPLNRVAQVWDIMLMQHLLCPDLPHDLEFIGSQFSNKPAWKHDKSSGGYELYCARDVDVTYQAWTQLLPLLHQANLEKLYTHVQVPLAKICRLMHETGFKIDASRITAVREDLIAKMARMENELPEDLRTFEKPVRRRVPAPRGTKSEKTGKPVKFLLVPALETTVPWRGTAGVEKYLYTTLALPVQYHAKTGKRTTDKNALDRLWRKTKNPAIRAITGLRKADELVTTFCKEQMTNVQRMFPHFNVHGTSSGRLSSSDPNLQNQPESARFIYVPSQPGWSLVEADYSQGENRLTAYLAGDVERLRRLDIPGFSEHKYAASKFFGIPYEIADGRILRDEVEKDNDKDAPYGKSKRIVHMTNYMGGPKTISRLFDLDYGECKRLQMQWKQEIATTVVWQQRVAEDARKRGVLSNSFGRKRWFSSDRPTEACSFPPQSDLADVCFRAMIALMYERIDWPLEMVMEIAQIIEALPEPARLLLQVHDSLVFECPDELVDEVVRIVTRVMSQPWRELAGFSIPVEVKVSSSSWGECEKYHAPYLEKEALAA